VQPVRQPSGAAWVFPIRQRVVNSIQKLGQVAAMKDFGRQVTIFLHAGWAACRPTTTACLEVAPDAASGPPAHGCHMQPAPADCPPTEPNE